MRRVLLALVLLLAAPASAQAAFDVSSFSVTPSGLQAGSHPDVAVAIGFSGNEHVRDLTVSLPPGLVGNPNATPKCAAAKFQSDSCAANTRVGTTSVDSTLLGLPITATGDVYNLPPDPGEPARLGVIVRPPLGADKIFLIVHAALRPSDGGLDSMIAGIPSTVSVLGLQQEITITAMNLTLLGRPGGASSEPFMTMPTGCAPATAHLAATSANGTAVAKPAPPFTPTDCDKLPFQPQFSGTISTGRKPSLTTVITGPAGNANTASAAVTLPKGVSVDLNAAKNACTLAQQAAGPCPDSAHVGTALAESPLLPPLTGPVSLAQIAGQLLPGVRVDVSGAVSLSLTGTASLGAAGLRTAFSGIPDVPLQRFQLAFNKNGAIGTSRNVCRGPLPRMTAELTGHNGAASTLRVPLAVTGCHKPIAGLRVHKSKLVLRVRAARAGAALKTVRLSLPKRLAAHPRRGHVGGGKLSRHGVLTVNAAGRRRITATLSRGAFSGKLGSRRAFVLRTVDVTGHPERQKIKARR
jgi:hypothetical protein